MSAATETSTTRPFQIKILEEQLLDLRKRISETKFPERETVTDQSHHGVGPSGRIPNSSITTSLTKAGTLAAWEQPQLFSEEVRPGFRLLRKSG